MGHPLLFYRRLYGAAGNSALSKLSGSAKSAAGCAAVAAYESGLAAQGWMRRSFGDGRHVFVLLGAEAQQGGDVSYLVELGIVFDVEEFDVVLNDAGQDGFAYVHDLARLTAADRTEVHQVGVEGAAAGTLDGLGVIILADQEGLHFAQFKGAEHATQSGDAAGIVAGLGEGFADHFLAAALLRPGENLLGLRADFFVAHVSDLGGKPAEQFLPGIGMQLRLELRT